MRKRKSGSAVFILIVLYTAAAVLAGFSVNAILRRMGTPSHASASAGTDGGRPGGAAPAENAPDGTGNAARPENPPNETGDTVSGENAQVAPEETVQEAIPELNEWADYPFMRSSMRAGYDEAEEYIYWELAGNGERMGRIYRMPKEGGEPELLVDKGELYRYAADKAFYMYTYTEPSFAVAGDDLYFSCLSEYGYAYFRLPLSGGEPEYLFTGCQSYLQAYGGSLYMILDGTVNFYLAAYTPGTDTLPRLTLLEEFPDWEGSSSGGLPDFAIRDGLLFYQARTVNSEPPITRAYDLETGETRTLYDSTAHGEYYCYWPFFTENTMYACKNISEKNGLVSIYMQSLNTGASQIISSAKTKFPTTAKGYPFSFGPDCWMMAAPLAGRLLYTTGYSEETEEYSYALAPFGDERNIIRTFTTTSAMYITCGPWAFLPEGVMDGRTGEIIPVDFEQSPMFTLDSLLPVFLEAMELRDQNQGWIPTPDDPWLLPNL